ncbi:hypothetical protein [Clostridium saccharoperbutylacetonicum]
MMKINWNILKEDIDKLKENTIETFDMYGNIDGQFEITFDTIKFGYVDTEIPFGNELLLSWFTILIKAVIELNKQGYVVFYLPDTTKWLEIQEKENVLFVSKLELIEKNVDFLITGKNQPNLFNKTNHIDKIEKCKFINCVLNESKEFINYICSINKKLKDSITIKEITALYNKASS